MSPPLRSDGVPVVPPEAARPYVVGRSVRKQTCLAINGLTNLKLGARTRARLSVIYVARLRWPMAVATARLEGRSIAEERTRECAALLARAGPGVRPATLASVHRPVSGPFELYRRRQQKSAEALGVRFRDEALSGTSGDAELYERIRSLASDPTVHGVIVEHPLPAPFDFHRAVDELPVEKDVDGLSTSSLGRLVSSRPIHVPAVARAAVRIARHYGLVPAGERVAVIGRSETVGLPLAHLLLERGTDATVTIAHSKTVDLASAISGARTIFSCVGHPKLLDRSNVPKGAAIIDIGLSSAPDPARPGRSLSVGDADAATLEGWARAITPVPGGVGPVTVAELMGNLIDAWARQEHVA